MGMCDVQCARGRMKDSPWLDSTLRVFQAFVPDWVLRWCVRVYLIYANGAARKRTTIVLDQIHLDRRIRTAEPVTTDVEVTNTQLYGNSPSFFELHLGPRLKYSSCKFEMSDTLESAERKTIAEYQELARLSELTDGSNVLELGCGWGSLLLSNAETFPKLTFVGFSNSAAQIEHIRTQVAVRGLSNVRVLVEDYAVFVDPERSRVAPVDAPLFDAVLAIETIEHSRNVNALLTAVAARMRPGAILFVQSLLHQSMSYMMGADSWMGRNFFAGGSILALNSYFHLIPPTLRISGFEAINGLHYSRTLDAWLYAMERHKKQIVAESNADFYEGFRAFYLVCSEAFASGGGNEFMCAYYTFQRTT